MALFVWDNRFKTNIAIIDEQHQRLIQLLNNLHDAMKEKKDNAIMSKTLVDLVNYTLYHFQTEERLLEQHNYPHLNSHRAEHSNLTKEVFILKDRFDKGEQVITTELLGFLKNWVNDHILGTDKNCSSFLRSKGVV